MKRFLAALVLGASALVSLNASANFDPNAGFAATVGGIVTIPLGDNLNNASSITFTTGLWQTSNVPATYNPGTGAAPNDFFISNEMDDTFGSQTIGNIWSSALTITPAPGIANFMNWVGENGAAFQFSLTSLVRNPTSPGAMDLYGIGTFTQTALGTAAPFSDQANPATASWRMTAQEIGGNISASFSWGTPAFSNDAPIPGILSLMGIGLLGLGAVRRRVRA
ncbi:hypothetical protein [Candidatus Thiodictyon syntrophicum]|jgi:hypothetical protein|uniref:PEP-CTERM protein-sorting domain-containing protein n=1 Tax=Candidatus Thiodictyon syntrophicum TaxID=1166950 RepID=A0A2K8U3P2_9GAMM|nr:hypothetical protein [Candidatus Thiodictyon syntrophicum]AUB80206.1 hypothetical protein THSYN_04010 [Candidatus Thiodictyon syntrophicum]